MAAAARMQSTKLKQQDKLIQGLLQEKTELQGTIQQLKARIKEGACAAIPQRLAAAASCSCACAGRCALPAAAAADSGNLGRARTPALHQHRRGHACCAAPAAAAADHLLVLQVGEKMKTVEDMHAALMHAVGDADAQVAACEHRQTRMQLLHMQQDLF